MSSDADYAAFLDQVNQDTGAGNVSTTQQSGFATTKTVDTDVPATLQTIDRYYTSDTDEAFEPVSLSWKNSALPDEAELQHLLEHTDQVSIVDRKDFDPRNEYADVFDAVAGAANGGAAAAGPPRVYHVRHGHTRAEYYLLALDRTAARLVGVKVKVVET